jgi:hypothetical protein
MNNIVDLPKISQAQAEREAFVDEIEAEFLELKRSFDLDFYERGSAIGRMNHVGETGL